VLRATCWPGYLGSVLGLRTDLNCFEIVDSAILQSRSNPRTATLSTAVERYNYQVAIASTSGFATTAQSFALTHRIPLISFQRADFWQPLRQWLKLVGDQAEELEETQIEELTRCLKTEGRWRSPLGEELLENVIGLLSRIAFGVLDRSDHLCLFRA